MAPARRGLGRGLDALLSPTTESLPQDPEGEDVVLADIAVEAVEANPDQPRQDFDEAALSELADSLRVHGLLQPVVVERLAPGRYRLIAGERRLRAARLAGLTAIPAVVRPATESRRHALELALIENLQRADLGPLEEAVAFQRLVDAFGLTHEAIALRVGRSRPAVANALRLLALPPEIQDHLRNGRLTAGHGRALLGVGDPDERRQIARRAVDDGLTVRQIEAMAQRSGSTPASRPVPGRSSVLPAGNPDDEAAQRGLEDALGTPVRIERRRRGGRLVVEFYDDEQLADLYRRLGGPDL